MVFAAWRQHAYRRLGNAEPGRLPTAFRGGSSIVLVGGTFCCAPGRADDEQSLLGLFDEAVLWLTDRGLSGQWGSRPWSERPETKERVASLAEQPRTHRR